MNSFLATLSALAIVAIVCFPLWLPFIIALVCARSRVWRRTFWVGLIASIILFSAHEIARGQRKNPYGDDVAGNIKGATKNLERLFITSSVAAATGLLIGFISSLPFRSQHSDAKD